MKARLARLARYLELGLLSKKLSNTALQRQLDRLYHTTQLLMAPSQETLRSCIETLDASRLAQVGDGS